MKITVKPKQEENCKVPFDEIPVGYVYVVERLGSIALKLLGGEAVLLKFDSNGGSWFAIADDYKGMAAYKILGKLTEIIVKEM